jgi:nucleoside-diphosphate-sugar epimerase
MKSRVWMTGATGFVGGHLVDTLLKQNFEISTAIRKSSITNILEKFDVNIEHVDFYDVESIKNSIESTKPHYIIHNAGLTKSITKAEYYKVNVEILENILKATNQSSHKITKLIFVSSLAAYGPLPFDSQKIITHSTIPSPITSYGKSKLKAEDVLTDQNKLDYIIVRPTAIYGPGEKDIFQMMELLNNNLEVYFGTKEQKLTLIYVTDLVDVIIHLMQSKIINKSYFVSDGEYYSGETFLGQIKKTLNKKTIKIKLPVQLLRIMAFFAGSYSKITGIPAALNKEKVAELVAENWICDIENLKEDINFEPKYNLEKGIKETIDWYKANNWLK